MFFRYFLNGFEMVPVDPFITVITFVFTFLMCCISVVRSVYFRMFSASFLITFLSPEIATSINIHVPSSLSQVVVVVVVVAAAAAAAAAAAGVVVIVVDITVCPVCEY